MAKIGGNSRKRGRMLKWCARYTAMQQRERNKSRRLQQHLRRFPQDFAAAEVLGKMPTFNR